MIQAGYEDFWRRLWKEESPVSVESKARRYPSRRAEYGSISHAEWRTRTSARTRTLIIETHKMPRKRVPSCHCGQDMITPAGVCAEIMKGPQGEPDLHMAHDVHTITLINTAWTGSRQTEPKHFQVETERRP
ncbi:uncharacterized [Tachysurus ichikawai]